ncbi:MAG: hypothetical protein GY722_14510 [bacterium]|nr:hypothetical protein [bacterium]
MKSRIDRVEAETDVVIGGSSHCSACRAPVPAIASTVIVSIDGPMLGGGHICESCGAVGGACAVPVDPRTGEPGHRPAIIKLVRGGDVGLYDVHDVVRERLDRGELSDFDRRTLESVLHQP